MTDHGATPSGNQPETFTNELSGNNFVISIGKSENVVIGNNSKMIVYTKKSKSRGLRKKEKFDANYPVTDSKEPISMEEKLEIKGKVGKHWKDLGIHLGFQNAELEQMEIDCTNDVSELIYQILTKWQQCAAGDATKANLAQVFIKMKRGDLADILVSC